jgi:23S rRNA (cytidine1920-2'-O)/16S rRNA (cytidine1409-2'-O)-methyltransferase
MASGNRDQGGDKVTATRADRALVDRGLVESRTRARSLIEAGLVSLEGRRVEKASEPVPPGAELLVTGRDHPWVSRGGVKLVAALDDFGVDPEGLTCLDLGASTGGFTEVLLDRGAARVYAVDVGHGQLAPPLRADPRVVNLERTHARDLDRRRIPEVIDLIVADVSFISLTKALPAALALAAPQCLLIALVKPQFELGRGRLGKGGIVRDPAAREDAIAGVEDWISRQPGWRVNGLVDSPIQGSDGNLEALLLARRSVAAG